MTNISHLTADYIGPDIIVGSKYDKKDIIVICTYLSGLQRRLEAKDFIINDQVVHNKGDNVFFATHLGVTASFVVKGISAFTNFIGDRTTQDKLTNATAFESKHHINKSQLEAYIRNYDGTIRKLDNSEYEITKNEPPYGIFTTYYTSEHGVTKKYSDYDELANIEITHGSYHDNVTTKIRIPIKPKFNGIFAWYEGFPLKEIKEFRPIDIITLMETDSGRTLRIPYDFPGITFSIIDNEDYTATVTVTYQRDEKSNIISYDVLIPIVIPKEEPEDKAFCVIYHGEEDEDVTLSYKDRLTYSESILINWNTFMNICNDNNYIGEFTVTAPKKTGLDNRFATVWEVICDGKTLKASIIKIYDNQ